LFEGGVEEQLLQRTAQILGSGATMICLLTLSDQGVPCYDEGLAAKMSALGAPAFACTPNLFPDLMAAAIQRRAMAAMGVAYFNSNNPNLPSADQNDPWVIATVASAPPILPEPSSLALLGISAVTTARATRMCRNGSGIDLAIWRILLSALPCTDRHH
jgi:hypothetical protein